MVQGVTMSNQSPEAPHMKTNRILLLALLVSGLLAVSVEAGDRHRNKGNAQTTGSSSAHYSAPAIHSSSGFRYGGNRPFAPSPRLTSRSIPPIFQNQFVFGGK